MAVSQSSTHSAFWPNANHVGKNKMAVRDELPGKPETDFPQVNQLQSQITQS